MNRDTIFALSSGRPPAAIAVIRITGPAAHEAGRLIAGSLPAARCAAVRDLRHPASGVLLDQALVLRFDAPASASGENTIEFQCHGGRAVADALLDALTSLDGLRLAEPGEFTRRAFENGRIDLTEAEGLADLIEAETESQRRAALALADGGLRKQIDDWRERLVALSAEAERAIDYDEVDDPLDAAMLRECRELAAELDAWLSRPRIERLKDGLRVVIAGPPNAGKSSLLNAIAGEERAIVTAIPGTTRDHIEVPLSVGGLPVVLTDTAGLREATDEVEAIGVARASGLIDAADLLIWLGDPDQAPPHSHLLRVYAKCDLPDRRIPSEGTLSVSSVTGEGMGELIGWIEAEAASILPTADNVLLNRRQADHLGDASQALHSAAGSFDLVLFADDLRRVRVAFDRLTGRAGIEDVLDALFSRFCLGK